MVRAASVPIPKFRKLLQHTLVRTSESDTNMDTAIHVMLDNFPAPGSGFGPVKQA